MILVVVANSQIADAMKQHEYMKSKNYYFLPVGGGICGMDFERIILDTIELDKRTLKWLTETVMVRLRYPQLPTMPDFLRNENLSDHLLKKVLDGVNKEHGKK